MKLKLSKILTTAAMLCVAVSFCVMPLVITSCGTTGQQVAMQTSSASDAGVRLAMVGWGAYVQQAHPGTNAETQVLLAFKTVKNAELGVIDASSELATNAMATNQAVAAQIILSNANAFLLKTIATYTNSVTK